MDVFEFKRRPEPLRTQNRLPVRRADGDTAIDPSSRAELIAAGREIEQVLKSVSDTTDVRFKVVIEGRTARFMDPARRRLNADKRNVNKKRELRAGTGAR